MKVLVDTSIWSLALRRHGSRLNKNELIYLDELKELINESRATIIGPIRQEILSGISSHDQFTVLKEKLSYFNDIMITTHDYESAAELFNTCRRKGIQGSHIDFLICAVSINQEFSIYTLDKDFKRYMKYCNIILHEPRASK